MKAHFNLLEVAGGYDGKVAASEPKSPAAIGATVITASRIPYLSLAPKATTAIRTTMAVNATAAIGLFDVGRKRVCGGRKRHRIGFE